MANWDRRADIDSRGAVLFREFWSAASALPNKWAVPFDPRDPVNTPNGVAPGAIPAMLAALKNAALALPAGAPLPREWPVPQLAVPVEEIARWRQANGLGTGPAVALAPGDRAIASHLAQLR